MKKIISSTLAVAFGLTMLTSCIEEYEPMNNYVSSDQAAEAPGSYTNFVGAITSSLAGQFSYWPEKMYPYDYGYLSFYQQRDVMGQDVIPAGNNFYQSWYTCSVALGPLYAVAQVPWSCYYSWIKNCNTVISLAGAEPSEEHKAGAGIAYAMRAMFYMDLARMFAQKTYAADKEAETVPIVTEDPGNLAMNPRATNETMWAFILSDLDKAEQYIADYDRGSDKETPDLSVVYGLKARAYLTMEQWEDAEKYAKLAQQGYSLMDEATYTNRETGFNTPNSSWMFCLSFKADDPVILQNDADSSWGSTMCLELTNGYGYASNYGAPMLIDRHLFETIPATDFRKKCFVDFALDEKTTTDEKGNTIPDKAAIVEALKAYSDYPESVYTSGYETDSYQDGVGGLSLKFRLTGGDAGHASQYVGYLVSVPVMRVEEMYLIEAEAAGMQEESRGITLLTNFAKTRDPEYVYGKHTDAYYNSNTTQFQNEVWWQRRVELWGEGFATFDIKRLQKGIIRSYANTNHLKEYRWNMQTPPDWMNLCIVQTETNNNAACTNNPTPLPPESESPEFIWGN